MTLNNSSEPVEIFTDTDTHVVRIRSASWRPVYFLVVPYPDAKGLVAFRGKQHEDHYSELSSPTNFPRLPHAVPVGGEPSLLSIKFDGELEVCRSMENGNVAVFAGLGVVATPEAVADYPNWSRVKVSPHPMICLPPLQLIGGWISQLQRNES